MRSESKTKLFINLGLLAAFLCVKSQCTDVEGAKKTLKHSGLNPIEVGGHDWLQGRDAYSTKFKAVTKEGDTITGAVTRGFFKGSTIRYDD